LPEDAFTGH
jgi:uncharacterized protein CbrC (UPF0167 family)